MVKYGKVKYKSKVECCKVKYSNFYKHVYTFILFVNARKVFDWFLYILLGYFIIQQIIVLFFDPWAVQRTYIIFINAPEFHNWTLAVLSCCALILWYMFGEFSFIKRIELVTIRLWCAVWVYELIWHLGNSIKLSDNYFFTWNWWFPPLGIFAYVGLYSIGGLILLLVTNHFYKVKYDKILVQQFLFTFCLFVFMFIVQGMAALDWSPSAIRYNIPLLWAATKIVGYFMWLLI